MAKRKTKKGSGKRKHGMPHGFVSKKQWRYFFVNPKLRARYAHKEAHKTPGGPVVRYRRLPLRKSAPGVRSAYGAARKKRR